MAGVSLNAIVGDNGIITNAMNANFKNQKAILQEYINQFYVEHFEDIEEDITRVAALQTLDASKDWIYKGKLGYVVDSDGYVHYFLVIENFPKEIRDQIKYGKGEKKYSDYVNCIDVWGVTEDLDVYYCKNGQNSMDGAVLGNLSQENGQDEVFRAGSPFAKKITGNETDSVTKSDLRGISSFTIDKSVGVQNLSDIYNFPNLTELTIQNVNLTSLDGIEYLTKLKRIYFIKSSSGNYSSLRKIPEQINYLFFQDVTNDEIKKFCSYDNGVGEDNGKNGADFTNLAYFGIYGSLHFIVDCRYDDRYDTGETCYHSKVDDISCISNLSKTTKERISNLFLNNNSLNNIDNLWEFKSVQRLRIEGNYLINLNGLYNPNGNPLGETPQEKEQGMLNLKYLHANSNLLGQSEGESLDKESDSLAVLAETTYDSDSEKYTFKSRFKNLLVLNIERNNIKFLNYLSDNYSSLVTLYMSNNPNLDLLFGVQSIMSILEKDGLTYDYDKYVADYISQNSKKITTLTISSQEMTANEFTEYFTGRENYLKKLTLINLTLTNDSKVQLTDKTNPTFDSVVNNALSNLTNLAGLDIRNNQYLTTVTFANNIKGLKQIDLRGTGVIDLWPLANNCLTLYGVLIDNDGITVANVPDENGKADMTAVEKLFNITYGQNEGSVLYSLYHNSPGVILTNVNLVNQLANSTNITNFMSGYYDIGRIFGDSEICFDLSKTKIKNFWFRTSSSRNGDKFLFPKTIENITLSNTSSDMREIDYRFDEENISTLNMVNTIKGDNCKWDIFMPLASLLPKVQKIDYYYGVLRSEWSLENYYENLSRNNSLKTLYIYGYNGGINETATSYNQLHYISNFTSLEYIQLGHMKRLTDVSFLKNLTNLKSVDLHNTGIHSLDFIKNLNELKSLHIYDTNVGVVDFDENSQSINNLNLLKDAFNKNLRTLNISNTSITKDDIEDSGIKNLAWESFTF